MSDEGKIEFLIRWLILILRNFQGNAHIIYNAHFYYFCAEGSKLIRFDLKADRMAREFVTFCGNLKL